MEYLDFEIAIGAGAGDELRVTVLQSPAGQTTVTSRFPFERDELERRLRVVHESVMRSRGPAAARAGAAAQDTGPPGMTAP